MKDNFAGKRLKKAEKLAENTLFSGKFGVFL